MTTDRANARIGTVLKGKWRLDALLGIGGTASVYAATHRNGKRVAVKMLHQELCAQEELVARFLREGYVANKIEHPGAVQILDDDRGDAGEVFLVMELLDGYSLEKHTKKKSDRLPLERALRVIDEALDVIAAAHAKKIIHRDIKPANIFLLRDGRVKVLDFGIARLAEPLEDGTVTQTGSAIGTPAFMPPEQARGRWNLVNERTDIWAMGATLFSLLSGERPRRAETVQEELLLAMTSPIVSIATVTPMLPEAVVAVVDKAIAFDMRERYADAREMQAALRVALDALNLRSDGHISYPSSPQPDTAPVLVQPTPGPLSMPSTLSAPASTAPPEDPPSQLTTGRPWSTAGAQTDRRKKDRGVRALAWVLALSGVTALGLAVWFGIQHATSRASSDATQPAPPPPPMATAPPQPAMDPPAIDPTPPTPTTPTTPGAALASASPSASHASPAKTGVAPHVGKPPPPPGPTPTNIMDQRF